ncbi:MAG: ribosome assembly RNA-binding protein YhbY [Coriobacteriaceae bacterium]|jgi:RNA-binding protein|nr:YhbY family RNA-binding protein [Olsenella sp.]MCI1288565.1 YhbY family RNA-binding protein [Olsenella sp.]RRF89233.1 MAG: ribosome assembly RNA-binding protein YhbY [Coriobacteriaceae bacterium]
MKLTGSQIRQLRSMCNQLKPTISIGKAGVEAVIGTAEQELEAHELVKCTVQGTAGLDTREAADELARLTNATVVQVIGHKFSIYRETSRKDVEKIKLS